MPVWPLYVLFALQVGRIAHCASYHRFLTRDVALVDQAMGAGYVVRQTAIIDRDVIRAAIEMGAATAFFAWLKYLGV